MRKAPLVLAVCGLGALAAGLLAGRAAWMPEPEAVEADPAADQIAEPEIRPENTLTLSPLVEEARAVGADRVAIPPIEPETLVRVEPQEPLSPIGQPLPPPKVDNSHIPRPIAEAAGRIRANGLIVEIAGVEIIEPEDVCTDDNWQDWPCGMRARTAFRGLLRGRAVACDVPPDYEGETITTACSVGGIDLGEWVVANGWGYAEPGGRYIDQEYAARDAAKGMYGPAPMLDMPLLTEMPDFLNEP